MDRTQIGVGLAIQYLGLPTSLKSFDDRLVLQKAIYLAQEAGVDFGYFHHWYLRGPYCPSLTRDLYDMLEGPESVEEGLQDWELDQASQNSLETIRKICADGPDRPEGLELLASVHFLITRNQADASDPNEIAQTLRNYRKNYSETDVASALEKLRECKLLPGETQT